MNVIMKRQGGELVATVLTAESIVDAWHIRAFNRNELITLREGCNQVISRLANDESLPFPNDGICRNLARICERFGLDIEAYYFVSTCSACWAYSTGVRGKPTTSPIPFTLTHPWAGEHLNLRLDLLNHLVECADLMLYHLDMEERVHDF